MNQHPNAYDPDAFKRADEAEDALFYAADRFVSHVDSLALATIEDLIESLVVEKKPVILDLMAGWDSHVRAGLKASVTGLGLNRNELARNPALSEYRIHDLNENPQLPFPRDVFDAVICSLSIDYVTHPLEVFRDVARVLKPGGMFLVVFSNRFFPQKVVNIWRESDEEERLRLVRSFFERSGVFHAINVFVSKDLPRPEDDRYAALGIPSDPVYAVYADKPGAPARQRPAPSAPQRQARAKAAGKRRLPDQPADSSRCPHCGEKLDKWEVPQTPFTEWPSEFQYVCFNDDCPYFLRGWETMTRQGNPGSYRFMYDPTTKASYSIPVLDKNSLKAGIRRDD